MGAEEIQHAEHPVPIGELISVAETIEQIVYIAHRIRREKPGGQEWNQLNKRAEFIIDGYVKQIQENPKKLNALREDVAHLNEINLLDVTEIQTAINKLNTAADEAKQPEVSTNQELSQAIQGANTIGELLQIMRRAEKEGIQEQVLESLRAQAEKIVRTYRDKLSNQPNERAIFVADVNHLYGASLFDGQKIQSLVASLY